MGVWQPPLPPRLAATTGAAGVVTEIRGVGVKVEVARESCKAEGGRG